MNNKQDFLPEMLKLNYDLIKTDGKLNGSRYPTTSRGDAKITNPRKNKQSTTK